MSEFIEVSDKRTTGVFTISQKVWIGRNKRIRCPCLSSGDIQRWLLSESENKGEKNPGKGVP